jgi:hypothetical protein
MYFSTLKMNAAALSKKLENIYYPKGLEIL